MLTNVCDGCYDSLVPLLLVLVLNVILLRQDIHSLSHCPLFWFFAKRQPVRCYLASYFGGLPVFHVRHKIRYFANIFSPSTMSPSSSSSVVK